MTSTNLGGGTLTAFAGALSFDFHADSVEAGTPAFAAYSAGVGPLAASAFTCASQYSRVTAHHPCTAPPSPPASAA